MIDICICLYYKNTVIHAHNRAIGLADGIQPNV